MMDKVRTLDIVHLILLRELVDLLLQPNVMKVKDCMDVCMVS
jgi:hypothetical protein